MTEQVAQGTSTDEAPVFPDQMAQVTFETINSLIAARNTLVGKINAVKGDRQTLSEQLTESSTNPDAVEARKRRDEAQALLDDAIMDLHKAIQPEIEAVLADSDGASASIEEEIKEADAKIKPAMTFFKKMYDKDDNKLSEYLTPLERLKGFSTRGAGSTGRRVRGYAADVTVNGETTGFDNLAGAAKFLGVDTPKLQEAFFAAAGNPEKLKDAPDRVDFEVTYTEEYEDGTSEVVTAKIVATREAKAEDEVDEAEATEVE